jgi:hypothetical protein
MRCINRVVRLLVIAGALVSAEANAVDQSLTLQSSNVAAGAGSSPVVSPFLVQRLDSTFGQRANDIFADQLQPFNMLQWSVRSGTTETFNNRAGAAARHAFSRSVEYGARDFVTDFPMMQWLDEHQHWLAGFLRDSVDSVEEESVAPLDVSYGLVEQSWWKGLSKNQQFRYGIRPFRTNPYTYMSFGVKDGDDLLFLGHVRYYYDHFADHRFEIALSVPLQYGFSVGAGTSYQFGRHDEQKRIGIKLSRELTRGGVVHVGFEILDHPVFIAGVSLPW